MSEMEGMIVSRTEEDKGNLLFEDSCSSCNRAEIVFSKKFSNSTELISRCSKGEMTRCMLFFGGRPWYQCKYAFSI